MRLSKKNIIIVLAAAVVLVGAFVLLRPKSSEAPQSQTASTTQSRTIVVDIVGGKLASGSGTVQVTQGEKITLEVTADTADEFHLHGYDKELELQPGQKQSVTFVADKAGSFEAELHHSESTVLVLQVQPK
ncbi:hypothetical protein EYC59_02860 [Candidatus Saccharibacteria bacterium]|nr:MAG: hypothetical protein EYC59_02860 [Candidatus Saccharibacteria bacterium]